MRVLALAVIAVLVTAVIAYKVGRYSMHGELESALMQGKPVRVGEVLITDTLIVRGKIETVCDICHPEGF